MQQVTSLQFLSISCNPELTSLPEWLGNLSSLQSLYFTFCPKIQSLPQSIQSLTKLKTLSLGGCGPELARRCQKGNGEDWYKIAHVPEVDVRQYHVDPPAKPKAFSCWMIKSMSEESDSDE